MKPHEEQLREELAAQGILTPEKLRRLEEEMKRAKIGFRESIVKLGFISEEDLLAAEADLLGTTYLNIEDYLIDQSVLSLVPAKMARAYSLIPVFKVGKAVTIATSDPFNVFALDEVRAACQGDVEIVLSSKAGIRRAIDQYYGSNAALSEIATALDGPAELKEDSIRVSEGAGGAAEEAPVIRLVNMMILKAVEQRASDIHVEPEEDILRVRNRVNGILQEVFTLPKKLSLPVASRIKIMSKLDISERRKPQDGKIRLKIENRELDIRVSTFPTVHGENVVMRLLETSRGIVQLGDLGLEGDILAKFEELIRKAYGMILLTGPTGAGKTTTLYSALSVINTVEKNIITIEDPIEYQLPLVRQTQVNVKAGLTFANGLRNILRQDPNVILVGEIRDNETADIAIQAALTGHLVFSTIHTNDSASAVARLLDMQIEPFLISSALIGVMSQRLVRLICLKCKEPNAVDEAVLKRLGIKLEPGRAFFRGKGCPECGGSGYGSRLGIFELLRVDEPIRRLIMRRASTDEIRTQSQKAGTVSMRQDGIRKAIRGLTSLEEILKVTLEEEI